MKLRSVAWLIFIAAVVIALVLVRFGRSRAETRLVPPEPGTEAAPVVQGAQAPANQPSAPQENVAAGTTTANPPQGTKAEQIREVLSGYNDEPILFYGKLKDQFGNPVADATVDFSIRVINGVKSTTDRGAVRSDAAGSFKISGFRGQDLSLNPSKLGYALASKNGWANYSRLFPEEQRAHPDAGNPVTIKMWKLQGAEPLVPLGQKYKLPCSDAPIYFDLLGGRVVPAGGDLKITVSRAPGVMSGRNRLDWNVRIEAIGGGLMDSAGQEETTYWAPADGYKPELTLTFSTNSPYAWAEGFTRGFFVMSRDGQVFSKLSVGFSINYNPADPIYVSFGGVASTNASRNWEGAPNTFKSQ